MKPTVNMNGARTNLAALDFGFGNFMNNDNYFHALNVLQHGKTLNAEIRYFLGAVGARECLF